MNAYQIFPPFLSITLNLLMVTLYICRQRSDEALYRGIQQVIPLDDQLILNTPSHWKLCEIYCMMPKGEIKMFHIDLKVTQDSTIIIICKHCYFKYTTYKGIFKFHKALIFFKNTRTLVVFYQRTITVFKFYLFILIYNILQRNY